jgi:hypothetical protein
MFETNMSNVERETWIALKEVMSIFLGNYREQNYKKTSLVTCWTNSKIMVQHESESSSFRL